MVNCTKTTVACEIVMVACDVLMVACGFLMVACASQATKNQRKRPYFARFLWYFWRKRPSRNRKRPCIFRKRPWGFFFPWNFLIQFRSLHKGNRTLPWLTHMSRNWEWSGDSVYHVSVLTIVDETFACKFCSVSSWFWQFWSIYWI